MNRVKFLLFLSLRLSGLYKNISLSSLLSILSLSVGVATLLVSLSLVDSYERSFKESIKSIFSHALVFPLGFDAEEVPFEEVVKELKKVYKKPLVFSPASKKEALLAHKGKVAGVIFEGVSLDSVDQVVSLKDKVIEGEYNLKDKNVLIGKNIFEKFKMKLGETIAIVVPYKNLNSQSGFDRKLFTFKVAGVLDLGSHDANKRFIVSDRKEVNAMLLKKVTFFSEIKVSFPQDEDSIAFKDSVADHLSDHYWVRTWQEKGEGLLEAIYIEKIVIFLLVLILVVVAAFNVSTNLYLNLSKRMNEFSLLRSLGVEQKEISLILVINGLLLALVGVIIGGALAYFIVGFLNWILNQGYFIPPEVYRLTQISIQLSFSEFIIVALASFVLCILAALAPAFSVFRESLVEGLRYD